MHISFVAPSILISSILQGSAQKKFRRNPEPTGTHFLGSDPEPTFWVPTWNPEPPGTHFGPICLDPGTHIFEIKEGSTRNPGAHGFLGYANADP